MVRMSLLISTILSVMLVTGCNLQQDPPPNVSTFQRTYEEPVEVHDAPRLSADSEGPVMMDFMLEGGGIIPTGTVNGSPDVGAEFYPRMFDGDKSCGLKPGTEVMVAGRPVIEGSYDQPYLIYLNEPCDPNDEEFTEGYIIASAITVQAVESDMPKDSEGDFSDLDLVFDHFDEGKVDVEDGSGSMGIGCRSAGQILIDDDDTSRVSGKSRRFQRDPLGRNAACVGNTQHCGINGETFRAAGRVPRGNRSAWKQVALEIKGRAATWKVNVSGRGSFPEKSFEGDRSGETVISFREFIPNNGWSKNTNVSISVRGYNNSGEAIGEECIHRLRLISPLVLDFSGMEMIETLHPSIANVRFDLDGSGLKQQTGWIKPSAAFLAIDLNNSGTIEDATQLFGEATKLKDGTLAQNGYQALAQYDENGDGVIDRNDPVYSKLLLWFDRNQDGIAQPDELIRLEEAGVTKIAVTYENVPEELQNTDGVSFGNVTPFMSKFWGPNTCGDAGCRSYDVFFQTTESLVHND